MVQIRSTTGRTTTPTHKANQIQGRTVGAEEEVRAARAATPLDLVYLLLDLQRLEVVKLWLVRLELRVEPVLARPLPPALRRHLWDVMVVHPTDRMSQAKTD